MPQRFADRQRLAFRGQLLLADEGLLLFGCGGFGESQFSATEALELLLGFFCLGCRAKRQG
ncbi:MAG: hypothetical protein EBW30_08925 [Synechococcaceae bacterium WB7_3xG_012]|nr:hypothetical protein [Synechococcaceae bacterium WB7_3xG_012]